MTLCTAWGELSLPMGRFNELVPPSCSAWKTIEPPVAGVEGSRDIRLLLIVPDAVMSLLKVRTFAGEM